MMRFLFRRLFCSPPSSRFCPSVLALSRMTPTLRRHAVPADGGKTGALSKRRGPVLTRPVSPEKVTNCDNVVTFPSSLFSSPPPC